MQDTLTVGIITVSDRAAAGEYEDQGGPALRAESVGRGWQVAAEAIVPDDVGRIQETIRAFAAQGCGLILTTGGTGIAPRDVTPEAIRAIMRVELPGFGEAMRMRSMVNVPNAILAPGPGGGDAGRYTRSHPGGGERPARVLANRHSSPVHLGPDRRVNPRGVDVDLGLGQEP